MPNTSVNATSVTVEVGYTTERPVVPDQRWSYVTVPLYIRDTGDPASVRNAELVAMAEALGAVEGRRPVVMVTSMRIVMEVL